MTVTDKEINEAARAAVARYGDNAGDHAAKMIRSYEGLENPLGVSTWQRIEQAIVELLVPAEPAKPAIKLTRGGYVKWW